MTLERGQFKISNFLVTECDKVGPLVELFLIMVSVFRRHAKYPLSPMMISKDLVGAFSFAKGMLSARSINLGLESFNLGLERVPLI